MAIDTQIPTDPLGFPSDEPLVFQTASPLGHRSSLLWEKREPSGIPAYTTAPH